MPARRRVAANPRTQNRHAVLWVVAFLAALAVGPLLLLQTGVFSSTVPTAPLRTEDRGVWRMHQEPLADTASSGPGQLQKQSMTQERAGLPKQLAAGETNAKEVVHTPLSLVGPPPLYNVPGISTFHGDDGAAVAAGDHFVVATNKGNITIKFRADKAPQHVVYMKKLIASKRYDGKCFYRSEKNFVLQGGLRSSAGRVETSGLPSPPLEYALPNRRGFVNMARWDAPDSAGGEWCILLKDSPHLDRTGTTGYAAGFTVWAEVVRGMDVVDRISTGPTKQIGGLNFLQDAVTLQSVTIV